MRNSKVRSRIAAGKLRLRIGVYTSAELRRRGAVRAFAELKRAGVTSSLNMFWGLAGALEPWPEGRHWREVARGDERLSLLLSLEDYERSDVYGTISAQPR